jgi:hypothetical protein
MPATIGSAELSQGMARIHLSAGRRTGGSYANEGPFHDQRPLDLRKVLGKRRRIDRLTIRRHREVTLKGPGADQDNREIGSGDIVIKSERVPINPGKFPI